MTETAGVDKAPDWWVPSEDPNVTLSRFLEHYLEVTKDVDFQAQLDGRRFADPEYEKRDSWWKMSFRAGPASPPRAGIERASGELAALDAAALHPLPGGARADTLLVLRSQVKRLGVSLGKKDHPLTGAVVGLAGGPVVSAALRLTRGGASTRLTASRAREPRRPTRSSCPVPSEGCSP